MKQTKLILDINAHISNIECNISNEGNAIISFDNIIGKTITAVKFNAKGYNSFGDIVPVNGNEKFFLIIQDINIEMNSHSGNLKATMPNSDIKKLELEECQICYSDGTVSTYEGKEIKELNVEEYDEEKDIVDALCEEYGENYRYIPKIVDGGWICSCGIFNREDDTYCKSCNNTRDAMISSQNKDRIKDLVEKFHQIEAIRLENEKRESEEQARKNKKKKRVIILSTISGLIIIGFMAFLVIMSGRKTFSSADEMKAALQGTYTYYSNITGKAYKQIVISGDKLTYKYSSGTFDDWELTINEWNYNWGTIKTFENLVITRDGDIRDGNDLYEKGGFMASSGSNKESYESAYSALRFSGIYVSSNSSYTNCKGTITNNGKKTYRYVEVKGAFKDSSDNVLDTDWTYAVGSEGLAPGESKTFSLSVPKNSRIKSCSVSILDYE